MKELWIKKTVYRRYLIQETDIEEVELILRGNPETADELIGDIYDKNKEVEYDQEEVILPIDYVISDQ